MLNFFGCAAQGFCARRGGGGGGGGVKLLFLGCWGLVELQEFGTEGVGRTSSPGALVARATSLTDDAWALGLYRVYKGM